MKLKNNGIMSLINCLYRISDTGYKKEKPTYINNENCWANFYNHFKNENIIVFADNISARTRELFADYSPSLLVDVNIGSNAGSLLKVFEYAKEKIEKNEMGGILYFVENDYIHREKAAQVLLEGFQFGDYITLYDHPDKYIYEESNRLFISESCHWKQTNSTTMTFAVKATTFLKDYEILVKYLDLNTGHPHDYYMFQELNEIGRRIVSTIPGYSTHGESQWLSPFIDWQDQALLLD